MDKIAEYRQHAERMRERAAAAETEPERNDWLRLAQQWDTLAHSDGVLLSSDASEPRKA